MSTETNNPINTRIINRLKEETESAFGKDVWSSIVSGIDFHPGLSEKDLSRCMYTIINRCYDLSSVEQTKAMLFKVRHGLERKDFFTEIEIFNQIKNIDDFIRHIQHIYFKDYKKCMEENQLFYGQEINREVYDYLTNIDEHAPGKRIGDRIYITSIPFRAKDYLHTVDSLKKRYYFCHCQFARESILTDKAVPSSICQCSLGYNIALWDAVLDTSLSGTVLNSVIAGDLQCRFSVKLPEDILSKYTKN